MGDRIVGKAYVKGRGLHYVEVTNSPEHFRLRNMRTGETIFTHRSRVEWRATKGATQ